MAVYRTRTRVTPIYWHQTVKAIAWDNLTLKNTAWMAITAVITSA